MTLGYEYSGSDTTHRVALTEHHEIVVDGCISHAESDDWELLRVMCAGALAQAQQWARDRGIETQPVIRVSWSADDPDDGQLKVVWDVEVARTVDGSTTWSAYAAAMPMLRRTTRRDVEIARARQDRR